MRSLARKIENAFDVQGPERIEQINNTSCMRRTSSRNWPYRWTWKKGGEIAGNLQRLYDSWSII
jgi:hypothetical protein